MVDSGGAGGSVVVVVVGVTIFGVALTTRNPRNGLVSDGNIVSLKEEDSTIGSESFQLPPRDPLR